MNRHINLAIAAIGCPLLLMGFWAARAISIQKSFELVRFQSTLLWVLVASIVVVIFGEIAYRTAYRKRLMRIAHFLGFACFYYILFHLSWIIDLSTAMWSNSTTRTSLPLTTGATLDLRILVSAGWSFLTAITVWMLCRVARKRAVAR